MRQIIRCRGFRSICYALVIALIMTAAPAPLSSPARAQLMPTYSVAVVEFVNRSGVQGALLARLATDAVVVEMGKTNRYDVSITRSQIKAKMDELDIRPPLDRVELVRLGEALSADAILEGVISSVVLSGSGPNRRASVTLVVQMIDQASGEIINGAVQTGTSSARVGFTPDDDALITEAINKAAFLVVKTMVDYIIPEATIMMNVGENQVMLNKGARDGLRPGMRMIVLRDREIIGFIELRDVSAIDSIGKVTKSMRGIQPEDKARAIFEMPAVTGIEKGDSLPSGAPGGGGTRDSVSKIGRFLVGAAVVLGLASLFNSGRGNEKAPSTGTLDQSDGIPGIRWDPKSLGYGKNVDELQILREDSGGQPVMVIRNPTIWDRGYTKITGPNGAPMFGTGQGTPVSYYRLDSNPATSFTETTWTVPAEPFGITHTYTIRVMYHLAVRVGDQVTTQYYYTTEGGPIVATAIEPVRNTDIIFPPYDRNAAVTEVLVSDLQQGKVNFQWNRKDGGNIYYVLVEPVVPGTGPTWQSSIIYETGPVISLPTDQRDALASRLAAAGREGAVMRWRVFCRNTADTDPSWVRGEENRFVIGSIPPGTP